MDMKTRFLICIPCHERRAVMEQCVPTVKESKAPQDVLLLCNDGSTEFDDKVLRDLGASAVSHSDVAMGIEAQRRMHFEMFADFAPAAGYTHLYLSDHDAIHDPNWRQYALDLQAFCDGAPVCLYNTPAHARLVGNTISDDPKNPVIWRRVAPGVSYLLTARHVEAVVKALPHLPRPCWDWDWAVPGILGHRFAIARQSHVDHNGWGGRHHPEADGLDGGDRCLNPTPWLVEKRKAIVAALSK